MLGTEWDGIEISSQGGIPGVTLSGNIISATGASDAETTVGYQIWNDTTTSSVTISGGSVTDTDYGVWVDNYDGYQSSGGSTAIVVSAVSISDASVAGIFVQDDPRNTTVPSLISAEVTSSTVITGSAVGIEVSGPNASLSFSGTAPVYLDAGLSKYIVLESGAMAGSTLDASEVVFGSTGDTGGFVGATGTLPDDLSTYYGIEGKITDYLDDSSLGYVSLKTGDVFVAQSSEIASPGAIQRGINVASSGDTVFVQGGTQAYDITAGLNIPQAQLTLEGAMVGVSGRHRHSHGTGESTLSGPTSSSIAAFTVANDSDVTIDGFALDGTGSANGSKLIGGEPQGVQLSFLNNVLDLNAMAASAQTNMILNNPQKLTLTDNQITTTGSNPSDSAVIQIVGFYAGGADTSNFMDVEGNTFTGIADANDQSTLQLNFSDVQGTVDNNTFNGVDIGVLVANNTGNLTLDSNIFENITRGATDIAAGSYGTGIAFFNPSFTNGPITVSNNTFENSDTGIRTSTDGTGGPYSLNSPTVSITGNTFTGDIYDIVDEFSGELDPSGTNVFDGVTLSAATLSDLYAIEDKIVDGIDVSGYGLVRLKAANIYVTPNSYFTPGGTTAPSIQRGIDAASDNDTVNVEAGTYVATGSYNDATDGVTSEIEIDKPLTLLGPIPTFDPNTDPTPALGDQAVVMPGASDPNPFDSTAITIIGVDSSGVTIQGMTIDGSNSVTPGFVHYDGGSVTFNGVYIDASEGISSYVDVGSISIANNIVENTAYAGVDFENAYSGINAGDATDGNTISENLIQNLGGGGYGYGVGVILYNNFYASVTANVLDTVRIGVQTGNYSDANPGTPATISDNMISAYRIGIFYNLNYDAASPFSVSGNTINASATDDPSDLSRYWTGVLISSQQGGVSATFSDNQIDGTDATYTTSNVVAGYTVWNTPTTGSLLISGGSVSGADYGVWVNNYAGYGPSDAGASTQVTVDGLSITASQIGVYVQDDPLSGTDPSVFATIEGDTTISATDGATVTGIEASGSAASVAFSGTLPAYLTGGPAADGGLSEYIVLASGAMGGVTPSTLDASQVSFDGFVGATGDPTIPADLATYFDIEDKITDYLDDPTLGYVSLKSDPVFVAQSSEAANAGAIQRGVNVAGSGDTVYVQGGAIDYAGDVTISQPVILDGANAGVNPVTGSRSAESVVNGPDFDFLVQANDVTINGFTIQGVTDDLNAGIYLPSTISGYQIVYNIVQNNNMGLYANSSGALPSLIQYNLIKDNTLGGPAADNGIYLDQGSANLTIDSNKFVDNAITFGTGGPEVNNDDTISNNQIVGGADAGGMYVLALTNSSITGNTITGGSYTGLALAGGDNGVTIGGTSAGAGNTISGTNGGIGLFGNYYNLPGGVDQDITISGNSISDDGTGILVEYGDSATITNNAITGNATGIMVGSGALDTSLVTAQYNDLSGNTTAGVTNNENRRCGRRERHRQLVGQLAWPDHVRQPGRQRHGRVVQRELHAVDRCLYFGGWSRLRSDRERALRGTHEAGVCDRAVVDGRLRHGVRPAAGGESRRCLGQSRHQLRQHDRAGLASQSGPERELGHRDAFGHVPDQCHGRHCDVHRPEHHPQRGVHADGFGFAQRRPVGQRDHERRHEHHDHGERGRSRAHGACDGCEQHLYRVAVHGIRHHHTQRRVSRQHAARNRHQF